MPPGMCHRGISIPEKKQNQAIYRPLLPNLGATIQVSLSNQPVGKGRRMSNAHPSAKATAFLKTRETRSRRIKIPHLLCPIAADGEEFCSVPKGRVEMRSLWKALQKMPGRAEPRLPVTEPILNCLMAKNRNCFGTSDQKKQNFGLLFQFRD